MTLELVCTKQEEMYHMGKLCSEMKWKLPFCDLQEDVNAVPYLLMYFRWVQKDLLSSPTQEELN